VQTKTLELLTPAKNQEIGIAAISHGADAVYIGAPKFGARAAVGNSLQEIEKLVQFAHQYWAKVYVTFNTILYDNELDEASQLINQIYQIGADALIIQDMGLLEMNLPPIPLFASTQTNNQDIEKIKFLEKIGFQRVILARELSLNQIQQIKLATNIDLEFFVHGALCISYSGQCYFSFAQCKRSANRGECAQMCRMKYSVVDSKNKLISPEKYLLSAKDLNLSDNLENLINAGISSFKIEGRLKDIEYVKNIVGHYRQKLDLIINNHKNIKPASSGKTKLFFQPDPEITFNRGYTEYFINGRDKKVISPKSPKSTGKFIGTIIEVKKDYFILDKASNLVNGDGICFFINNNELIGVNINNINNNHVYPNSMSGITCGLKIYRNYDRIFFNQLNKLSAERKINISMVLSDYEQGFTLSLIDEDNNEIAYSVELNKIISTDPTNLHLKISNQLNKLGNTIFSCNKPDIFLSNDFFIPTSTLNEMRRQAIYLLELERIRNRKLSLIEIIPNNYPYPNKKVDFSENIANSKAEQFYKRHGVESIEPAFEKQSSFKGKTIMTTKHCLKYEFGLCKKHNQNAPKINDEPLFLKDYKNKYLLEFDCEACEMKINII